MGMFRISVLQYFDMQTLHEKGFVLALTLRFQLHVVAFCKAQAMGPAGVCTSKGQQGLFNAALQLLGFAHLLGCQAVSHCN